VECDLLKNLELAIKILNFLMSIKKSPERTWVRDSLSAKMPRLTNPYPRELKEDPK
jgi:hypothetical protein